MLNESFLRSSSLSGEALSRCGLVHILATLVVDVGFNEKGTRWGSAHLIAVAGILSTVKSLALLSY